MKTNKIICAALCLFLAVPFVSCANGSESSGEKTETAFTDLWIKGVDKTINSGETVTVGVGADMGDLNYIRFDYETNCYLDGTMYFTEKGGNKTYSERFFLTKEETEFRQILNYYHTYNFSKVLDRIELKCVGSEGGIKLKSISAAVHPIDFSKVNFYSSEIEKNMQLYITGKNVKMGVSLKSGGAVNYVSSLNEGVRLSNVAGKVYVGQSDKGETYLADDVNLINANDTGRLIQQSYYGTRGNSITEPQDDYQCGIFDSDGISSTPGILWPYNPVQGGDQKQNFSHLIDVRFTDTEIYVKTRPMDWAKDRSETPFYMENTYTLESDPVYGEYVKVINKGTDFSGYKHNNVRDQELPAFYGITPLGKLASYRGNNPWENGSVSYNDNLDFWSPGTSENRFKTYENWIAWLNEDNWGIGLYVPDVTDMLVGRASYTTDFSLIGSQPSLAPNCTYTAPLGHFSMPNYESFGFTYFLKLDNVEYSRALFKQLHESGVSNGGLIKLEAKTT